MSSNGSSKPLTLQRVPIALGIMRLPHRSVVPTWAEGGAIHSVTRTPTELSIIVEFQKIPEALHPQGPFATYRVKGTLEFALVGILARITTALAEAGVPAFAMSTFDTDYVLVPAPREDDALVAWAVAGIAIER
ncbi:MAG: ACT domain-containing protein [Phycisphaerae bacterium]|nr:ACT domain-containing protein [Phycisphaerae bacterium]